MPPAPAAAPAAARPATPTACSSSIRRPAWAKITDGASKTALAVGKRPGRAAGRTLTTRKPNTSSHSLAPISDALCNGAVQWNVSDPRGFAWVNGEFRCAPLQPLHDAQLGHARLHGRADRRRREDCSYTPYGWRTARSRHPGGVNLLLADGSLQFIADTIDAGVWTALSTIAGGEAVGLP